MLDHERYGACIASLKYLIENQRVSNPDLNRERLLDEQYKTQVALQNLSVTHNTPPSGIPMIDEVIINPRPSHLDNYFSLIGMPNSGKTSTLLDLSTNQPDLYWVFGDTARRSFGMLKQRRVGTDFAKLTLAQEIRSNTDISFAADSIYVASMLNENPPITNVLFERDWTDLPFFRANFLFGRIDVKILEKTEENFRENLSKFKGLSRTIINCLLLPLTSKKREKEQREHLVVQDKFLTVLYEQYLRFHYEMLNFKQVYKQEPSFGYIAIDMSNKDPQNNIQKLENYIKRMQQTNMTYHQTVLI